jgi:hypothetical protein
MALVADDYVWAAGTVAGEPSVETPRDGHHAVVRFVLNVTRKGGVSVAQPVEARGATAQYLQSKGVKQGDFVMAAGIIRTEDSAGATVSEPYLLLRVVSTDTSETLGE